MTTAEVGSRIKQPPRNKFSMLCTHPDCATPTEIVRCTCLLDNGEVCGQFGHPDLYKCSETEIVAVIEHGHFLPNKDIYRNVVHRVGKPFKCPESMKVYTWRTYRSKDRWEKMPNNIKLALGWSS